MQAIASGEIKDIYEAREIITNSFDVKVYEPKHNDAWEDAYKRFLSICGKEF